MDEKLPEGWVWTTLGEVRFDLAKGIVPNRFPGQFFELYSVPNFDLGIPELLQGKDIKSSKQIVDSETVLLCKINPRLNRAWVVGNFSEYTKIASTEWIPFFNVPMILPVYLCYYLRQNSVRDYFAANASGVGGSLMRINDRIAADYPFPLAPLPEQSRIVAAIEQQFTRLDSAVASLQSARAKVKQYRASLLKSAVEGELTKQWRAEHPAQETGAQLLKRILAERRTRWEEEELAKMREKGITPKDDRWKQAYKEPQGADVEKLPGLPEGWCWATVEQLAAPEENSITDGPFGSNLKKEHYKAAGPRVIRLQNIGDGFFRDEKAFVSQDHFDKLRKHQIFAGDLVIAALGDNPPRSCIMPASVGPAIVKADCIRYKVSPHILNTYVNTVLNSEPTKRRTSAMLHGVGRPRLNLSAIKSIVIPVPPYAEQQRIMSEVEANLSNIAKLEEATENNLKRAEHERQSILREAFAGRLVPQNPDDEPASVLLARIREERKKRDEVEQVRRRENKMEQAQKRGKRKQVAPLYDVLVEAGGELRPEELYKRSEEQRKEKPEQERDEEFYVELDTEARANLIVEERPASYEVLLRAIEQDEEDLEDDGEAEESAITPKSEMRQERKEEKPRSLWDE